MTRFACLVLTVSILAVLGCQAKPPALPPTAKVEGAVTLDGKPMEGGEVRFQTVGQPVQTIAVKDGKFSGSAYLGQNQVDVVWEKDGPRNPTDPNSFVKVNTVSDKFSGGKSPLKADVGKDGASGLKFEVTSAGK